MILRFHYSCIINSQTLKVKLNYLFVALDSEDVILIMKPLMEKVPLQISYNCCFLSCSYEKLLVLLVVNVNSSLIKHALLTCSVS